MSAAVSWFQRIQVAPAFVPVDCMTVLLNIKVKYCTRNMTITLVLTFIFIQWEEIQKPMIQLRTPYLKQGQIPKDLNVLWINSECTSITFDSLPVIPVRPIQKSIDMPTHMALEIVLHKHKCHEINMISWDNTQQFEGLNWARRDTRDELIWNMGGHPPSNLYGRVHKPLFSCPCSWESNPSSPGFLHTSQVQNMSPHFNLRI